MKIDGKEVDLKTFSDKDLEIGYGFRKGALKFYRLIMCILLAAWVVCFAVFSLKYGLSTGLMLAAAGLIFVLFFGLLGVFLVKVCGGDNLKEFEAEIRRRQVERGEQRDAIEGAEKKSRRFTIVFVAIVLIGSAIAIFSLLFGMGKIGSTDFGDKGTWGSDGYYTPTDKEMEAIWDNVDNWMDKNW